jgi:hypothetical protein
MAKLQIGDIWRVDLSAVNGNPAEHWLLTDVHRENNFNFSSANEIYQVGYIQLESGRAVGRILYTIDMSGSPYFKKVA